MCLLSYPFLGRAVVDARLLPLGRLVHAAVPRDRRHLPAARCERREEDAWLIFVLFVPFLGVFVYLIANSDDMAKRNLEQVQAAQSPDGRLRPLDRRLRRRRRPRSRRPRGCSTAARSPRPSSTRSSPRPCRLGTCTGCLPRSFSGCWPPPSLPAAAVTTGAATPPRRGPTMSARRSRPGPTRSRPRPTRSRREPERGQPQECRRRPRRAQRATSSTTFEGSARPTPKPASKRRSRSTSSPTTRTRTCRRCRSAVDDASGSSGIVAAITAISGAISTMGQQFSATFTELEQLDPGGELETAFNEADSCDELRSGG